MQHNNITADVLYSARILVLNLGHGGGPVCFDIIPAISCVLPYWLGSKRSTRCASPKRHSTSIRWSKLRIVLFVDIAG